MKQLFKVPLINDTLVASVERRKIEFTQELLDQGVSSIIVTYVRTSIETAISHYQLMLTRLHGVASQPINSKTELFNEQYYRLIIENGMSNMRRHMQSAFKHIQMLASS